MGVSSACVGVCVGVVGVLDVSWDLLAVRSCGTAGARPCPVAGAPRTPSRILYDFPDMIRNIIRNIRKDIRKEIRIRILSKTP